MSGWMITSKKLSRDTHMDSLCQPTCNFHQIVTNTILQNNTNYLKQTKLNTQLKQMRHNFSKIVQRQTCGSALQIICHYVEST